MNNGKNYHILDRGSFVLPAPTQVNNSPAVFAWHTPPAPTSQLEAYGSSTFKDIALAHYTPHQFSGNSCRTIKVRLHPKCKTRYFQSENNEDIAAANIRPIKNGIYLMYWTDSVGTSSRWPAPPVTPAGTYVGPQITANWRTRV